MIIDTTKLVIGRSGPFLGSHDLEGVVFRVVQEVKIPTRIFTVALLMFLPAGHGMGQYPLDPPTHVSPGSIQTLPIDPLRRSNLQTLIDKHDYAGAEKLLVEELEHSPKSPSILIVLADVRFLHGDYPNSVIALKKAETLSTLSEQSRFLLALAYVAMDQGDLAIPELEKIAQASPAKPQYQYWLSRLAYQKMNLPSAVVYAQKAVQLDPTFMKAYDQLGLCYEARNEPDDAIKAYQSAIRLNRQQLQHSPWPSMNLGRLLFRLERLDDAERHLRESVDIDPRIPLAHFRLGQLLEKQRRHDEAIQELEQAARLDPSYAAPYYVLGNIYKARGDLKAAEKALTAFQELRKQESVKGIRRPE